MEATGSTGIQDEVTVEGVVAAAAEDVAGGDKTWLLGYRNFRSSNHLFNIIMETHAHTHASKATNNVPSSYRITINEYQTPTSTVNYQPNKHV